MKSACSGTPLQEFHRRDDEMGRPVRPRALEDDGDPPVAQPAQASLPERRAAEVLAEPLQPLAVARGDVHGRMEVEAAILCVERHVALDPRRVGSAPTRTALRPARASSAARPRIAARERLASAADSSASRSASSSALVAPVNPRRSSRRRTRATTRCTSSSVGGTAGWKRSVPSASRTKTPSRTSVWKWR